MPEQVTEEAKRFLEGLSGKEISRNLVGKCDFCNIGKEEDRGVYSVTKEFPGGLPNMPPKRASFYECGVRRECSIVELYSFIKSIERDIKRLQDKTSVLKEPYFPSEHLPFAAGR